MSKAVTVDDMCTYNIGVDCNEQNCGHCEKCGWYMSGISVATFQKMDSYEKLRALGVKK